MNQDRPQPFLSPGIIAAAIFTALYVVAAIPLAWGNRNWEFVFYIAVLVVLAAAVAFLHRRIRLSTGAIWALSIWGLLHMAGGLLPVPATWPIAGDIRVLYSWWLIPDRLKFDQIVHAYGFAVTTWVCWQGLRAAVSDRAGQTPLRPTLGLMILCAAAGMGFGALNEVVEFVATLTVPETNVGGYVNTGWDLVANAVGSSLAAAAIWLFNRDPRADKESVAQA